MMKNRITILAFLLALFLLPSGVYATDNLLSNGNFEQGTTNWVSVGDPPGSQAGPSAFTSWTQRDNGGYPISQTQQVTDPVIEGSYTAHITGSRADGIYQYPGCGAGNCTVSAWVYVVSGQMILGLSPTQSFFDYVPVSYTGHWEYVAFSWPGNVNGPFIYGWGEEATSPADFYVDCVWFNEGSESTSPWDPSTGFDPNAEPPIADAGLDQVVFDEVTLDGSASNDPDGSIDSYEWKLEHMEDSAYDRFADGERPTISELEPGFYNVTLTVTDNDGSENTDTMLLAAAGPCDGWPQTNADFNLKKFKITKFKKWNYTIMTMFGTIELPPELNLGDGDIVDSRITIELFDALPDGHLVMSDEATLTVRDRKYRFVIKK